MKQLIFLFPIFLFLIFFLIKVFYPSVYFQMIQEDSYIESTQALVYFITAIVSLQVSRVFLKHHFTLFGFFYILLAILFLFIFFEELSWGQRILHVDSLQFIIEHNAQRETTVHNLKIFNHLMIDLYIIVGLLGTFSWMIISKILPSMHDNYRSSICYIIPDWYISSYFFFVFFIYTVLGYARPYAIGIGIDEFRIGHFLLWRDQEPMELILSLGFLVFTITNYIKIRFYTVKNN